MLIFNIKIQAGLKKQSINIIIKYLKVEDWYAMHQLQQAKKDIKKETLIMSNNNNSKMKSDIFKLSFIIFLNKQHLNLHLIQL